jgi:hypothetical protein
MGEIRRRFRSIPAGARVLRAMVEGRHAPTPATVTGMNGRFSLRAWLATMLACALSFTVAACAAPAGKGPETAPPGSRQTETSRQAQERTGAPSPAETPPGTATGKESSSAAMTSSAISGERLEIRKAWIRIRVLPDTEAQAIALAYGNDVLEVVKREGDWVQVRVAKNRMGWIPADSNQP